MNNTKTKLVADRPTQRNTDGNVHRSTSLLYWDRSKILHVHSFISVPVSEMSVLQIRCAQLFVLLTRQTTQRWCARWRTNGKQGRWGLTPVRSSTLLWAGPAYREPLLAPPQTRLRSAEHWRPIRRLIVPRRAMLLHTAARSSLLSRQQAASFGNGSTTPSIGYPTRAIQLQSGVSAI